MATEVESAAGKRNFVKLRGGIIKSKQYKLKRSLELQHGYQWRHCGAAGLHID